MLQITIPSSEYFDDKTQTFINIGGGVLQLEHSLVAISKWEAKWHKAFLGKKEKTSEELLDYVRCMTLTPDVDPMIYLNLSADNQRKINDYIENRMSATYINKIEQDDKNNDTVTSELIYYWMTALQIPFECQYWHLNRLLTLIQVCNIKNKPPKKMNRRDLMRRNSSLNAARRKHLHSKG